MTIADTIGTSDSLAKSSSEALLTAMEFCAAMRVTPPSPSTEPSLVTVTDALALTGPTQLMRTAIRYFITPRQYALLQSKRNCFQLALLAPALIRGHYSHVSMPRSYFRSNLTKTNHFLLNHLLGYHHMPRQARNHNINHLPLSQIHSHIHTTSYI